MENANWSCEMGMRPIAGARRDRNGLRMHFATVVSGLALLVPQTALAAPDAIKPDVRAASPAEEWPTIPTAPKDAPNVLLILTDDVGFAAASTFGGVIPTPTLDRLASNGLRYNNFHTTAMCSPTRAALLTGRNSHAVATGIITDLATAQPGYHGRMPKSAATIAEVLRLNGFNTAFFGKEHNVPRPESSVVGPFDRWPTGKGFEYFFGFLGGETDQWSPGLTRGTSRVKPPGGQVLDKILADDAINWIHNQKAADLDKPFFIYYAPASAHAPHQAPREWIDRFKGVFDKGWDMTRAQIVRSQIRHGIIPKGTVNTSRPGLVPAWESLTRDQKRHAARLMEVYAGMLAYQDFQVGRIIDELQRMGQLDNTLIFFIEGDNGGESAGGPLGASNDLGIYNGVPESDEWMFANVDKLGSAEARAAYPIGWSWAMNAPFPMFKRYASHLGGIRNGMVVSWPKRIERSGAVRSQFSHVIDVAPTIYEAVGVVPPAQVGGVTQQALDGASLLPTLLSADAPSPRSVQYFELQGNRGIYRNGWFASAPAPNSILREEGEAMPSWLKDEEWELFDLRKDFSQSRNVARQHPALVTELKQAWLDEARKNNVLPVDPTSSNQRQTADLRAHTKRRTSYVYWAGDVSVAQGSAPQLLSQSFAITADIAYPESGPDGVIVAQGDSFGGWSFHFKDGRPVAQLSISRQPEHQYRVIADEPLSGTSAQLKFAVEYEVDGPGAAVTIFNGERKIGSGRIPRRLNLIELTETFDIGRDTGGKVSSDYSGSGEFSGTISSVIVKMQPR